MCGASGQQASAFANEKTVSGLLTTAFQKVFGQNTNIIDSLNTALQPIIAAGPNQFGFSPAEAAAMRTQATDLISSGGEAASNAARSAMASRGGGNTYLPSGSEAAINAGLAEQTAQQNATAQEGITQAGYQQGRQNFFNATSGLAGETAQLESPIGQLGNAAVGAAGEEMSGANAITQANNAWLAPTLGLVGGLGSAAIKAAGAPSGGDNSGSYGGCWIITAIYGKNTPTTRALWAWMTNEKNGWNQRSSIGKIVVNLYYKYGEKTAELVKRNRVVHTVFKAIFDWLLRTKVRKATWLQPC